MILDDGDTERALYCVNELVDRRRRTGVPVPTWMVRLGQRLNLASLLTTEMSASGHGFGGGEAHSDPELLLGSREAADILGLSTRQVGRLAADLDGEKHGRDWVFRRSTVIEYAEGRRRGGHRRGV